MNKFRPRLRKALSLFLSAAMLTAASPTVPVLESTAADTCIIDTATEYQTIKGFGGMNHPEWTGSDLTEAQRQTAFGNGDDELGLSIVRIYVNNDKNQWYKALATAQDVVARGGIVFATPWNPPSEMCETFTRTYTTWNGQTATQENQKRLRHDKYADYAAYLNEFVHYMKDNGVELYAISIQNEPDYGEDWTWMTSDECVDFLENYADQIDCPVMSPESFSYNKEYYTKILNSSKAFANTDIFGTHFYGTSRENMDFPALESCGKEIFMTEVYVPNSSSDADTYPEALDVSENIHNALVVGNMNAYVWWYIRRSYGPMKEDGTISKRGYCMAQYSKFVRPGDVRIEATEQPADNVYISAYKNDSGQVTVVAINKGTESYSQNFTVSSGEKITGVSRYRTSASESLAYTADLTAGETSFWAQLPAESVSTFIITLDTEIKADENGYYFHDTFEGATDSWDGRGSAETLLSGRFPYMDDEALLVQGRASSWNGAQKSLSTAVFVPGNEYSFSVCAAYLEGDALMQNFALTLQYTDANGDTKYANIASASAVRGSYVQLANTNYKIPEGASNLLLYVETTSGTDNFYIDEAIGAVAGTKIDGPAALQFILGDVNCDGVVDAFDVAAAKYGLVNGFSSTLSALAADVDQDGTPQTEDLVQLQDFVLGKILAFTASET
jgi:glucuronoarabinoxylan endo-1,4-beta-xylanase